MNKSQFLLIFSILFSQYCFGQMPKGTWREHLPYNKGQYVASSEDLIYCATPYSLFTYDIKEGVISKKSKIQGLSDLGIGHIAYSKKHKTLLVGYLNGNLDAIIDGELYNFPGIKEKNIMFDKSIKHITIHNDSAFIATGFGIVVFNLSKKEIADTYIIGPEGTYSTINNIVIYQNKIMALTPSGILWSELNNPFLSDFKNWQSITDLPYGDQNYFLGVSFDKFLLVAHNYNDTSLTPLSLFNGTSWAPFLGDTLHRITSLRSDENNLIICFYYPYIKVYNTNLELQKTYGAYYNNDAELDENGILWNANNYTSLYGFSETYYVNVNPEGPNSANAFSMLNLGNNMLIAPGTYNDMGFGAYLSANVFEFRDEKWSHLRENKKNDVIDPLRDVVCLTSQNDPNHYFAGTWGYGIFEVINQVVENIYSQDNTNGTFDKYPFVSGMSFDSKGNLWTVHRNTTEPFKVKTKDNKWYSYDFGGFLSGKTTGKVLYAKNGDFWSISHRGDGIMVWNDNQTPENGADDEYLHFYALNEKGGSLDKNYNCIAQDANGAMWIGTNNGVVVFDYPQNVLAGKTFYARTPQIIEEGYLKPLLEEKKVTSIAIDGGNRKWLGTEGGGLFLVSDDGTSELISFNQSTSPLFSDNIQSLCLNSDNGELFIGTDKGLQSYMTTSSGSRSVFSEVYAFPNPVRPDYSGFITIRGLMYNSNVKIVDLTGHLVFETTSEGGDAVWNGLDLEGSAVASGIYTVLLNNPDGSQSEATKILIIR